MHQAATNAQLVHLEAGNSRILGFLEAQQREQERMSHAITSLSQVLEATQSGLGLLLEQAGITLPVGWPRGGMNPLSQPPSSSAPPGASTHLPDDAPLPLGDDHPPASMPSLDAFDSISAELTA